MWKNFSQIGEKIIRNNFFYEFLKTKIASELL